MNDLTYISTEGDTQDDDFKALSEGLLAHHASQGHPRTWKIFNIFIKDSDGKAYGGVVVKFTWNGMYIQSLWVDESLRGQGHGTKLMKMAEEEARKRGCTIAYTDTFEWQAGKFYEKLGYTLYGKLEGFPENSYLSYYRKSL